MEYYDQENEWEAKGIDPDLFYCLKYNPQTDNFKIEEIEKVLAVFEGAKNGPSWRWLLKLANGKFVFLQGGCDYTGWNCHSWADSAVFKTFEGAYVAIITLGAEWCNDNQEQTAYDSISRQLIEGKLITWHEKMDKEFGLK